MCVLILIDSRNALLVELWFCVCDDQMCVVCVTRWLDYRPKIYTISNGEQNEWLWFWQCGLSKFEHSTKNRLEFRMQWHWTTQNKARALFIDKENYSVLNANKTENSNEKWFATISLCFRVEKRTKKNRSLIRFCYCDYFDSKVNQIDSSEVNEKKNKQNETRATNRNQIKNSYRVPVHFFSVYFLYWF